MLHVQGCRRWCWAAAILAAAVCAGSGFVARAEDGAESDESSAAPRPMAELAAELGDLQAKVDAFDEQIDAIRKGRLAEISGESLKLNRDAGRARSALSHLEDKILSTVGTKYEREYAKAKDTRDEAILAAKRKYDAVRARYSRSSTTEGGTRNSSSEVTAARRTYDTEVANAKKAFDSKKVDIRRRYSAELEKAKNDATAEADGYKDTVRQAEDKLKTLAQESSELVKKINDLQGESRPLERQLLLLRRDVADRPEEAMAAGLWPRNGRYALDDVTGKLTIAGGLWGKPTDSEEWRRSNQYQANTLLSLAKQQKEAGQKALARECLELIVNKFPDTNVAGAARELLGQL